MRTFWSLFLRMITLVFFCVLLVLLQASAGDKTQNTNSYDQIIEDIANQKRVPASLIHSIILAESNYDRWAISPKGAMGLMQLMPETAEKYGVKNVFNPKDNIVGGVKYLIDLIKLFNGDTKKVLAAYNAGQEAIKKYGGIPPYRETRNYVKKVMASFPKDKIITRTKIYKYYDDAGRLVLTNNKALYLKHKKNSD